MNILVFSWRDPKHPLAGGAEQVTNEHMKGWVMAGHKVTHFSSYFKRGKSEEMVDGITFIRRGPQLLGVQLYAFFWYIFGKHPKFDLVVDEFHGIPFFTPLYTRAKKLALLQEVAREVWLKNDLPFPFNFIFGEIGYLFEPLVYLFYKNIPFMVGSESAKAELSKMGISKNHITIVHHGVILDLPKVLPKKEANTIIFLGALAKDKGIEDAIKSFSLLSRGGDYKFWVVGKGGEEYVSKLKKQCDELGLNNKVKFWGFVENKKKFDLLAKAKLMINPSLLEGWGLVNIEANSVGTPVVAYNSPGLIDCIKNNVTGIICEYNSPENIEKEARKLLSNERFYDMLRRNAILWSKNFSWKKSRNISIALIEKIGLK